MKKLLTILFLVPFVFVAVDSGHHDERLLMAERDEPASLSSAEPLADDDLLGVVGALAQRWKCAIAFGAAGVGLFAGALASGGLAVPAILAPLAGNVAAFCLI